MEESEQGKVTGGKIRVKRTSDTTAPYRCLGFTQREMGHFQQKSAWFKSIGLAAKLTMDCGEASQKQRLIRRLLQYCRRRQWHPTPVLLPGNSHRRRSLVGCSLWGREESDRTERLHFHFSLSCIGEVTGNPLQCSWLENPRDRGAWCAVVYGVAQSWTRLKRLTSSSSMEMTPPLMAESEEELKSLLLKVKEKSGKAGLKLNIQNT